MLDGPGSASGSRQHPDLVVFLRAEQIGWPRRELSGLWASRTEPLAVLSSPGPGPLLAERHSGVHTILPSCRSTTAGDDDPDGLGFAGLRIRGRALLAGYPCGRDFFVAIGIAP